MHEEIKNKNFIKFVFFHFINIQQEAKRRNKINVAKSISCESCQVETANVQTLFRFQ
jgi:hypothetical protein